MRGIQLPVFLLNSAEVYGFNIAFSWGLKDLLDPAGRFIHASLSLG